MHRNHGLGTWQLDRVFRGVGRIRRASGTNDLKMAKRLDTMLTSLYDRGRLDVLEGIRDKVVTPMQVWPLYQVHELERLPTADSIRPFAEHWAEWLISYQAAYPERTKHVGDMRSAVSRLSEHLPKDASVHDLPMAFMSYKHICREKHPTFNHCKVYVMGFVNDVFGPGHTVYRDLQAIKSYPTRRKRHPIHLTPQEAQGLVASMDRFGEEVWALMLSGMNPKEYWGRWDIKADHIAVYGTKREGRYRQVPLVDLIAAPSVKEWRLPEVREALHKVRPDMQLKDCRNICSRWMAKAGIIGSNIDAYMGWGAKGMRGTYQWDEAFRDVPEDGGRLREYLGVERKLRAVK